MTLTPEQIEAQRVKFESVHPVPNNVYWDGTDYYKYDQIDYVYDVLDYRNLFRGWISCIESNEIELQEQLSADLVGNYYDADELIKLIESQGFKVKV